MLAAAINGIVLLGGGTCSRISAYFDPKEDFTMARSRKFLAAGAAGVAAVALVAASTSVTGAYFSDSHDGTINSSTGAVKVDVSGMTMNFDKLLPGDFKTQTVTYTARGTEAEDIWLVFPTLPGATNAFLNGQKGTSGEEPSLGRYGHFAVQDASGATLFTSYNLKTAPSLGGTDSCFVDANGHGGDTAQAANAGDYSLRYCPVPNAIKIGSSISSTVRTSAVVTFGYTKLLKGDGYQNLPSSVIAPFKIVATQVGILPSDPNNVVR